MNNPKSFLEDNYGKFSNAEQALVDIVLEQQGYIEAIIEHRNAIAQLTTSVATVADSVTKAATILESLARQGSQNEAESRELRRLWSETESRVVAARTLYQELRDIVLKGTESLRDIVLKVTESLAGPAGVFERLRAIEQKLAQMERHGDDFLRQCRDGSSH